MKKDVVQSYRISEETRDALAAVAKAMGSSPAQLATLLVEKFVETHGQGKRVVWPPEFETTEKKAVLRKFRVNYAYEATFEEGEPLRESTRTDLQLADNMPIDPNEEVPDHHSWLLIYKILLEDLEWHCEKSFEKKPKEIQIKIWNLQEWGDIGEGEKKGWYSLMAPEGSVI